MSEESKTSMLVESLARLYKSRKLKEQKLIELFENEKISKEEYEFVKACVKEVL